MCHSLTHSRYGFKNLRLRVKDPYGITHAPSNDARREGMDAKRILPAPILFSASHVQTCDCKKR